MASLPNHHRLTVSYQDLLIDRVGQKIGWLLRDVVVVVDDDLASGHVSTKVVQPNV